MSDIKRRDEIATAIKGVSNLITNVGFCPFGDSHEWDCSQGKTEWKGEHIADWNRRIIDDRLTEENAQLKADNAELFHALISLRSTYKCPSINNKDYGILRNVEKIIQKHKESTSD